MTRSSPAWCAGLAWLLWMFASMWMRTCLAQLTISSSSPREAVASAGGVTVVAQLPGFGVINGLINAMHNNRFNQQQQQQQQFERLQQGRPGMGSHRRGMPRPGFAPPNRQQPTPPGWPPGWQWGAGGNQNQPGFGWDQTGFGPGWNGGGGQGPEWNGGGGTGPEWNGGGGTGPGWNGGGGRGPPPPRPGWNGGGGRGPPPSPGWNGGGPPPPRPGWNGGGPPPPGPGWNGGGPPPPRPGWNGEGPPPPRPGWNGGMEQEWDNPRFPDQPDPNDTNPNGNPINESSTTTQTPVPEPSFPATTPKPAATFPTIQPRPPAQPTKDTLIIGTNRPPLVPPQNPDPPTPTFPTWIVPEPLPKPVDESSENRAIIFPSSSKYVHVPNQEAPSVPIDVRRR